MTARDRLFAAARALFESEGLEGLSIREVGRRAGMSAMAIYRHFPDKDALVDALMDDGFQAWEAIALAIDTDDPVEWLTRLIGAYRDFALEQPHKFDATFLLPARKARTFPEDANRSPVFGLMMAKVEAAQGRGRMRPAPALEVALLLSALAQGLVSMQRARRFASEAQFRASYDASMATAFESLLTNQTDGVG
ncbi:TetR/AcrR family transcriptional regulator [Caulobacter sp. 17J80-11]|uniref:TetR/AcrR family transcriptional regulator n=1 Tax=Caulobacter sp. 17J80-11 TaxID=2763502 RepID=UPI001653B8C2|nr:TetR/AcrR family transcriptional regulator [Caulobacter sp. 17J80-11]MBC6982192.1 TetR/AcrR family transcriptional regulator [Caulobacter sp. 17J80-11]